MQITQILSLSLDSLKTNRLRTMLTILGVVVGIFSIIVIMTVITMLQNTIESGVSFLNKNTFQIQKYPAIHTGGPGSWRKFRNRKDITLEDFYRFEQMMTQAKYVGAQQEMHGKIVKFGSTETNPNISVIGVTMGAFRTNSVTISDGREINETDVQHSNNVCVLGDDVTKKLFTNLNPVGMTVRVDGYPLKVIGTLEKQPEFFGQSMDNYIILPITSFQSIYGRRAHSISITVQSYGKQDYNSSMDAATGYMRTIRKVAPGDDNDFDIFSNESLVGQINDITGGVRIGAVVVSIIALLAAGVGIMNIMLVSVTERTREIGIRKAVGAKRINILAQFLFEAIVLCIIGGFIGIALGIGIGNFAGSFLNAETAIPVDWVLIGLGLCIFVGVVFGTYPAYKAANLDPIEALRYE
ncbi:MAG TPA: ABC transporter permease [Ignavibacteriaceae bacterium]|nr:ABC transporter permease [Ignavibacteriaceae bacterium]